MDLSVIIASYNMQSCIAACLRSITRCPKDNIDMECLVVDGGSEDETAAVVKRYIQRDSRIRLISQKNGGVPDVRNRAIEEASGKYIMFLDANDRLCEDAWEQIEAAVEEAYADFVAFSYIAVYENGKFKAKMLPISDVISTDEQEARKLMYADSVFNTCWGKLFRSDIVRYNDIAFRTDLPAGDDRLFVAEYFGHCESYLMTKAMIVYHMQSDKSVMCSYGIKERLDFLYILYVFDQAAVVCCSDSGLTSCMHAYYLKVLTDLFYEYAKLYRCDKEALAAVYKEALENQVVHAILNGADGQVLLSKLKKYEHGLLKKGNVKKISRYFSLKAMI